MRRRALEIQSRVSQLHCTHESSVLSLSIALPAVSLSVPAAGRLLPPGRALRQRLLARVHAARASSLPNLAASVLPP